MKTPNMNNELKELTELREVVEQCKEQLNKTINSSMSVVIAINSLLKNNGKRDE